MALPVELHCLVSFPCILQGQDAQVSMIDISNPNRPIFGAIYNPVVPLAPPGRRRPPPGRRGQQGQVQVRWVQNVPLEHLELDLDAIVDDEGLERLENLPPEQQVHAINVLAAPHVQALHNTLVGRLAVGPNPLQVRGVERVGGDHPTLVVQLRNGRRQRRLPMHTALAMISPNGEVPFVAP